MINLLIFDLDGTLIDSKKDIAVSLNHALEVEGFPVLAEEKIQELVGHGAKQLVHEALGNPNSEELNRVFLTFWNYYYDHLLDQTQLYPGVLNFLEAFFDYPKAIVTNKPEAFSKKILEGLKVDHYFQWLVGGDTLPIQKPDPRVFDLIVKDFEKPFQALMVGDSEVDIECGRAAGFLTCGVSYGFRPHHALELARPDFLIDEFAELARLPIFSKNFSLEVS